MSELKGDVNLNLANGFTLIMVIEITANLQNRRKVIYEIGNNITQKPLFILHMDENDFLFCTVCDQHYNTISTPAVSPNRFAAYYVNRPRSQECERTVLLTVRITPVENDEGHQTSFEIEVFVDYDIVSRVAARGKLPNVGNGYLSIGSAFDGSDPATFSLGENIAYERSLDYEELYSIRKYIKEKWNIGREVEEIELLLQEQQKQAKMLLVEDKYDQIYKVAWLKLNGIEFQIDELNEKFKQFSHFSIFGCYGASGVAGILRSQNPDLYKAKRIVGLFDFDKEGVEQFHFLSKEPFWKDGVVGDKRNGLYRKRSDHPHFFGLLLPIPDRLSHLADIDYHYFANYITEEHLLPADFLSQQSFVEEVAIPCSSFYKIKERAKRNLWKKAASLEKDEFSDFVPLFEIVQNLISR